MKPSSLAGVAQPRQGLGMNVRELRESSKLSRMKLEPWLFYALLSAVAASFVGIFGKVGMKDIDSNLATTVRSVIMTILLIGVCTVTRLWPKLATIDRKSLLMIA